MIEIDNEKIESQRNLKTWLFNPFRFIAGGQALFLGLLILLPVAVLGWLGKTHFDGVLDVHTGRAAPLWLFITENIINWLSMVLFLSLSALILSRSSWRFIDILGTQALARWPSLITVLAMLPEANRRFGNYLMWKVTQTGEAPAYSQTDVIIFGIAALVSILMIIWMIVLMYRGYTVSCNLKGPKAGVSFFVSLILAEILSKIIIVYLLTHSAGTNISATDFIQKSSQGFGIAHKFENDPEAVGKWQSEDFVADVNDFQPGVKLFAGELFLKNLILRPDGTTSLPGNIWTKGLTKTNDEKFQAQYYIKIIDGQTYLFYPWLSGDVTIRGMKPQFYVLKKLSED